MTTRNADWQSFPIEFRDEFPSLEAAAASGRQKRRGYRNRLGGGRQQQQRQQPSAALRAALTGAPAANAWQARRPSHPEWSPDDVQAANEPTEDPAAWVEVYLPEEELKTVKPKFLDRVTARSRFDHTGYGTLANTVTKKMTRPSDPTEPFRRLALTARESDIDQSALLKPDPSAAPKWHLNLPDRVLTEEYALISYARSLGVSLGPQALEELLSRCPYNPVEKRKLPIYKTDPIVAPPPKQQKPAKVVSQVSLVSQHSERSWHGPSNDVRLSGSSASSSYHDQSFSQYGRQSKPSGMLEFHNSTRNSCNGQKEKRRDSEYREPRYNADGDRTSRSNYNHDWDDCYEYGPNSNRYDDGGYGRRDGSYRSEEMGGDYECREDSVFREEDGAGYREDSGYHGEYEAEEYGRERVEQRRRRSVSPPAQPVDKRATEYSNKTPDWRAEEAEDEGRRDPSRSSRWRGRWTSDLPVIEEREAKERTRSSGDQKRDQDPDARFFWKSPSVWLGVRKAFRCLAGVSADSCTAFADDMHRVELSTWSGDEDAVEVVARLRSKFGIDRMEEEREQRRVHLALPRTTITLSVGAGGETEILFDGDCADVLVRRRCYEDVRPVIEQRVIKARDFISHAANKNSPAYPHETENTVLTMASAEESREVREFLIINDVDAKKIPRDLITGNWDGSYAQRECLLELEWERHGTHGFSVRFKNLKEQNNKVNRIMQTASAHFTHAVFNMEEHLNRMYVAVPSSPFPVDDDMRFLKDLLEENGVGVEAIFPLRVGAGPQTIHSKEKQINCTFAINRRMLKVAIEQGVWAGFHPRNPEEWNMMLDEGRFSWDVEMHNEADLHRTGTNSATVRFDSYEQGERIATHVQRMTPCPCGDDRFILNREDRKGVFARAKLRVHYNVPVHVHALTSVRLKQLDETWRRQSHFTHADFHSDRERLVQWTCLVTDDKTSTPPGFCRLVVEGFPRRAVEDSCAQLLEVIRGDVIKCDGDEEWLLTGIGRNMADAVAKEALEKNSVLVDFNVLGKEIRLIGERSDTWHVEMRLRAIAKRRNSHVVDTLVTLRQPVYMNRTCDAIINCGGMAMVEKVVGECRITACLEDPDKRTLRFEGTVAAYDRFRDFLGEVDDTLRASAKAEYEKMRKANPSLEDASLSPLTAALLCPICYCRPSADFYRLEACGHVYCTQCIYHQLSSELATRTLPLKCSREGCGRPLAVSDLLRLLLGRDTEGAAVAAGDAGAHLDEMKLRPLVTAIVTNALQTKKDKLIACRTADCAGIFPRVAESNSLVRCKTCERTACGACGYEPHSGYECEEYESLRDNVDVSIASYMKNKKVRKCPNKSCSAVIEKTVGCNHMECVLCRTHFCWLCGHASRTQGDIYAHMQNDHGGNGLHMDDGEMFMLQFDD